VKVKDVDLFFLGKPFCLIPVRPRSGSLWKRLLYPPSIGRHIKKLSLFKLQICSHPRLIFVILHAMLSNLYSIRRYIAILGGSEQNHGDDRSILSIADVNATPTVRSLSVF
jgi:hypothetical protein